MDASCIHLRGFIACLALLIGVSSVHAFETVESEGLIRTGFSFDDNATLGRRGQFRAQKRTDYAGDLGFDLVLTRPFGGEGRLILDSNLNLSRLRTFEGRRGYEAATRASFERNLGSRAGIAPELTALYHREKDDEWTFRSFAPGIAASYDFDMGLMSRIRYAFTLEQFPPGGTRNSYGNIGAKASNGEMDLKLWQNRDLRHRLVTSMETASYRANLSRTLSEYAELETGEERSDVTFAAREELMLVLTDRLVLTPALEVEENRSNSDAFTYRAVRPLLDFYFRAGRSHELFASAAYGRFDFFRERFDPRFENTREDFRLEWTAHYRMEVREGLHVRMTYRHLGNDSNDSTDFDPLVSRSFSTYTQNRIESQVIYAF